MIPYLLAAIGGYFIGESQKKEKDAPKMASGGQLPRYFRVSFMGDNYGTTAWGHTESEAINNARKSLKLGDDVEVKDIVEIKFRNGVPVSDWAKELRAKGRQFNDGGMMAEEVLDMKIKKYEEAYKNPNLTTGAKKSIRMKLNELKAYRKGTHNELSKYGKMEDGGMTDYYEDLRVYVQGVGTIYQGNSLSEATDVFDEYYANNPHAEMVMVDEKYGDEIKWANTSSTDDNDD